MRNQFSVVLFVLGLCAPSLFAEPRLPHLFSDHMVLQRNAEIRVWGWADPGEKVTVTLAGQMREVTGAADSRWQVALAALPAGGPFVLEVRGKQTIVVKDVMIGEVWVASGQSNMAYALSGAATAEREVPKADDSQLRFYTVPKRIAMEPQADTLTAEWELCSSDTAKKFSAVAYFFARDLRRALNVPVGVILSAWPGTAAEAWTDPQSLRADAMLQPIVSGWEVVSPEEKEYAVHPRHFSLEFDDFELLPADADSSPVRFSKFHEGSSQTSAGGEWSYSWKDGPATQFELVSPGRDGKGYAAKISGDFDGTSGSYWRASFQRGGAPFDATNYAGIRFWVKGKGSYIFSTIQPSISDWDNYSAASLEATSEWKQVTIWFKDLRQAGWGVVQPLTLVQLTGISISCRTDLQDPEIPPGSLYQGMIAPLFPYGIRGAIWYQGESNTGRAFQYRKLLPAMVRDWRKGWNVGDFPFLVVQLRNEGQGAEFADSWWAELREAQLLTAKNVNNVGLTVTIDLGDPKNLHPPRKEEVGDRLAAWALGTTYGVKKEYSGPIYESMRIAGSKVHIRFTHTGSGLAAKGRSLQGFTIAGADKRFHHATARIEGEEVIVSSLEVSAPAAVRYAWADSPDCNLYNSEDLPASPFRTDDWPGATYSKR